MAGIVNKFKRRIQQNFTMKDKFQILKGKFSLP